MNEFVGFSVKEFGFEGRYIASDAMIPTLQMNDRLIVNKLEYRINSPQRQDIIVFNPTLSLEEEGFQNPFISFPQEDSRHSFSLSVR